MTDKSAATLPGIVERLIPSPLSTESEKAQIHLEGEDVLYRELRIENKLINKNGEEVSLKPGGHVEVTVKATPEATTGKNDGTPVSP